MGPIVSSDFIVLSAIIQGLKKALRRRVKDARCRKLLLGLLHPVPSERLTAAQALEMP